jgi:hypothetical protein
VNTDELKKEVELLEKKIKLLKELAELEEKLGTKKEIQYVPYIPWYPHYPNNPWWYEPYVTYGTGTNPCQKTYTTCDSTICITDDIITTNNVVMAW